MIEKPRPTIPPLQARSLLAVLVAVSAGLCMAEPSPKRDTDRAQLQADCRLEGEVGGLTGNDLEQFVEECVADLQSVEFGNTAE